MRHLMFGLVLVAACTSETEDPNLPGGAKDCGPDVGQDASADRDAGAEGSLDATTTDTGLVVDASRPDGMVVDAGVPDRDAGMPDTGIGTLGRWQRRMALPQNQQEIGVAALLSEVYVIGGIFGAGRRLRIYDPVQDSWRSGADVPRSMHHANVAAVNDKLYIVGSLNQAFGAMGQVFEYDPCKDTWTERTAMPAGTERGASAVGVIDGEIYVVGGQDGSRSMADFSKYDPSTHQWTALPSLPVARNHIVGGAVDRVMYVIGGRAGGIRGHDPEVFGFDLDSPMDGWQSRAPMLTSRAGAAAAIVGRRIFVFGGEGNPQQGTDGVFAETEAYDVDLDRWFDMALMRTPRHGMGAAAVDGVIYVPGGGIRQGGAPDDTVEAFTPP